MYTKEDHEKKVKEFVSICIELRRLKGSSHIK